MDGVDLATQAATALGLPLNSEPESSIGFTLVGTTYGDAAGLLVASASCLCAASSFYTGAFVFCMGENCAPR